MGTAQKKGCTHPFSHFPRFYRLGIGNSPGWRRIQLLAGIPSGGLGAPSLLGVEAQPSKALDDPMEMMEEISRWQESTGRVPASLAEPCGVTANPDSAVVPSRALSPCWPGALIRNRCGQTKLNQQRPRCPRVRGKPCRHQGKREEGSGSHFPNKSFWEIGGKTPSPAQTPKWGDIRQAGKVLGASEGSQVLEGLWVVSGVPDSPMSVPGCPWPFSWC